MTKLLLCLLITSGAICACSKKPVPQGSGLTSTSSAEAQRKMDEEFAAQAESARLRFEADMRRQEEEQRAKAQAERETRYKQLVREALKDPDSAQFRNIRFVQGGSVMCGEVNAKNGFGGYAGFTSFVVDEKRGAYIASGDLKGWPMPIETEYGCR